MQTFGSDEYGNKDGFDITCKLCGKEARIVPISYFERGKYDFPYAIVVELRCSCGNRYGATIDGNTDINSQEKCPKRGDLIIRNKGGNKNE